MMFLANWDNTGVTVELGDLLESGVKIFDFDYPAPRSEIQYNGKTCKVDFDRKRLEQKIIDHYRFRQTGQETPAQFKHYQETRMCEIMPYYVQVYEFDAKFRNIEDPLESYNLLETFTQETQDTGKFTGKNNAENTGTSSGTTTGTSSGETSGNRNKTIKFSDTPQGSIQNLDNYMTTATQETESETGTSSGTTSEKVTGTSSETVAGTAEHSTQDTGKTTHTLNRRGNIGVQPLGGEVMNIRSAFINIDLQIINDLNDLFLQVY